MSLRGLTSADDPVYDLPLHVLTDRQRVIVQLRYCEGWTFTRIAAALHSSKQSINRSNAAASRKMKAAMLADGRYKTFTFSA